MRLIVPDSLPGPRQPPRHCERCGLVTREGKAFCSDHVDEHPYVQRLMDRLAEREVEDERVGKRGPRAANLGGITSQEILCHLAMHGPRTEERLCRELNLDARTLHSYVTALRVAKAVTLGVTKRGSTLVKPAKRRQHPAQPTTPAPKKSRCAS